MLLTVRKTTTGHLRVEGGCSTVVGTLTAEQHTLHKHAVNGDSVACKAVVDANCYSVEKLECVNHSDKRMGTALQKKAKQGKLGGRRDGALTANACTTLRSYYRYAIINKLNNPEKIRQATWASFLHCTSTDEKPQHQQCPDGHGSWCFLKKAVASGQQPPPHKQNVGTPMSPDVAKPVKPIYDRMSDLN